MEAKQAKKMLAKNLANLERKVSGGRTLTAQEITMVHALASENDQAGAAAWAKNQFELSKALDVTRKTVQRWLREPGNPGARSDGRFNVVAWREFAAKRGHGEAGEESIDVAHEQARNILLQNERLENRNAIEKKQWISRGIARQVFTQLVFAAKTRCFSGIPRIVTLARMAKDTTDGCEEVRKEMEDIWQQLTTSEWFQRKNLR